MLLVIVAEEPYISARGLLVSEDQSKLAGSGGGRKKCVVSALSYCNSGEPASVDVRFDAMELTWLRLVIVSSMRSKSC